MKKNFLFIFTAIAVLFAVSCSKDDDNKTIVEEAELVGNWQLTNVDFTVFEEGGRPASDACIVELVTAYQFKENGDFEFVLQESAPFPSGDFWTWEGDIDSFVIVQTNPAMPPYNFGLTPTNLKIVKQGETWKMTFNSVMGNGSKANFTLVKTETIDRTRIPALTKPDGSSYYCGFFD